MSTTNSLIAGRTFARTILAYIHRVRWLFLCVLCGCSDSPAAHYTPPPPTPINFSGPAPDPSWIDQKTTQYTNSGTDESQAAYDARLAYMKKAAGYGDPDPPKPTIITPPPTHGHSAPPSTASTRNNPSPEHPPSPTAPPPPPESSVATAPTPGPTPEPPLAPAVTRRPVTETDPDSPYMIPRQPIQPHDYSGDTPPAPNP